ncbi:MAG: archaellin/type IV pilin N-terminal domain-containing protein [Candidatus Hadarchaeota archaeon]
MMERRGISPIIATVLLVAITVAAAVPVATWLSGYYSPFRPRYVEIAVYAGLITENIARFHIQHVGGETIRFDLTKPTTDEIRGWASHPTRLIENEFYGWTFENPERFRQSDWAYAEVQLREGDLAIGSILQVRITSVRAGLLYDGEVVINSIDQIPGG